MCIAKGCGGAGSSACLSLRVTCPCSSPLVLSHTQVLEQLSEDLARGPEEPNEPDEPDEPDDEEASDEESDDSEDELEDARSSLQQVLEQPRWRH
jgi:hypothetical protein